LKTVLSGVAMEDDVFEDDDSVVNDQADSSGEAAEGNQVETLAENSERDAGEEKSGRNDQAGDERSAPIAKKKNQDGDGEQNAE